MMLANVVRLTRSRCGLSPYRVLELLSVWILMDEV